MLCALLVQWRRPSPEAAVAPCGVHDCARVYECFGWRVCVWWGGSSQNARKQHITAVTDAQRLSAAPRALRVYAVPSLHPCPHVLPCSLLTHTLPVCRAGAAPCAVAGQPR